MPIVSDSEESVENEGGCTMKDAHNEMRTGGVDIGGKETSTKELMQPQKSEPKDYDAA